MSRLNEQKRYLQFCEMGWRDEWMPILGMSRQALHGEWLGFDEGAGMSFSADLPQDMKQFLRVKLGLEEDELLQLLEK